MKMRWIFQGDSITDAGRSYDDLSSLGDGYVRHTVQRLQAEYPDIEWDCLNKGISGDRTVDLVKRWDRDCIDLQPDIVSVLIGVNDTARAFDQNMPMTPETFEETYRFLLEELKAKTTAKIVMMEQFLLPGFPQTEPWFADLNAKIHITRRLAREFADVMIPFDGLFAAACLKQPPAFWAQDGVHPSAAGSDWMSERIIEWTRELF